MRAKKSFSLPLDFVSRDSRALPARLCVMNSRNVIDINVRKEKIGFQARDIFANLQADSTRLLDLFTQLQRAWRIRSRLIRWVEQRSTRAHLTFSARMLLALARAQRANLLIDEKISRVRLDIAPKTFREKGKSRAAEFGFSRGKSWKICETQERKSSTPAAGDYRD
jgi:hypothetical protein